jgi:hypothetical protein
VSSKEKLLERIRQKPRNVREGELISLMEALGFTIKKTKEGGYIFRHHRLRNRKMPTMAHPHGRETTVLFCYVQDCLDAIDELEEEEE